MLVYQLRTLVPGTPEKVWEHVTAYPVKRRVNRKALEEKHGRLLQREGADYTFQDDAEGGITWHCTFEPPHRRVMRAPQSAWADRIDRFESATGGTLWTVRWEPKATGFRTYTQWLSFRLRGKRQAYQKVVAPVLRHFAQEVGGRSRTGRPRARRRRR